MKGKVLGLLAVGLLAGPMSANAIIISGTWTFTAGAYTGSFSFSGLDTSQTYVDSTAAGFSLSTNFDTSGNGGNAFSYNAYAPGTLVIGGLVSGLNTAGGAENDFILYNFDFPNSSSGWLVYYPAGVDKIEVPPPIEATFQAASVPEPGTLALLGLGLAGLGLNRRRKAN